MKHPIISGEKEFLHFKNSPHPHSVRTLEGGVRITFRTKRGLRLIYQDHENSISGQLFTRKGEGGGLIWPPQWIRNMIYDALAWRDSLLSVGPRKEEEVECVVIATSRNFLSSFLFLEFGISWLQSYKKKLSFSLPLGPREAEEGEEDSSLLLPASWRNRPTFFFPREFLCDLDSSQILFCEKSKSSERPLSSVLISHLTLHRGTKTL